jgi:hypothetical protein
MRKVCRERPIRWSRRRYAHCKNKLFISENGVKTCLGTRFMRFRDILLEVAIGAGLAVSTLALAQSPSEDGRFDKYIGSHPRVADELKGNPSLVNDPEWVSKHPGFQKFIQNHPAVREELKQNPGKIINHEKQVDRSSASHTSRHH